jgi:hypothetical protein
MAISWGAAGTVVASSGSNPSLTPTAPSSSSNSFNILHIGWKSSSIAEPTVTSSTGKWIRMGIADSASDIASGLDTGSTSTLRVFAKLESITPQRVAQNLGYSTTPRVQMKAMEPTMRLTVLATSRP